MSKRIIVDFDGTIINNNVYPNFSEPKPGVKEALKKLKEEGYYISIHSCRNSLELTNRPKDAQKLMEEYLKDNDIPFDEIIEFSKPVADYYIDDRAIEFKDNWGEIVKRILEK